MNNHKVLNKLFAVLAFVVMLGLVVPSFNNTAHALPGEDYVGKGSEKGKEQQAKKDKAKKDAKKAKDDPVKKSGKDDKTRDKDGFKIDENEKSDAQEEKDQEERAKALNPGKNAPGGNKKEANRKENNPTKAEKKAQENVKKKSEAKQKEEKEDAKKVEENKGTENDSRKNAPDKQKNEEFSKDAKKKGNDPKSGEKIGKIKGNDSPWTLYAQMIMGQAIDTKKQDDKSKGVFKKAFDGAVSGIIGNGGVQLDIPYSKFSAMNKELVEGKDVNKVEGGENGRDLASFLATYSKYGIINTVSGNKIASEGSELFAGLIRIIGGFIALIGLVLYTIINKVTDWFAKSLVVFNPYHALGFDEGKTALPDNAVSKIMTNFINSLGLNGEFITTMMELGIFIVSFLFLISLIMNIFKRNLRAVGDTAKKWIVRILVIVVGIPVLAMTSSGISKSASQFADMTNYDDSPVIKHLVDTRAMASGTNLSPDGLQSESIPSAGADKDYIDESYEPSKSRNRIANINKESYSRFYKDDDESSVGFRILSKWMLNNNFNVNTYIADLRTDANLPGVYNYQEAYKKARGLTDEQAKKLSRRDLEYIMWSGTQNADEDLRKPDFKNFNPSMPLGVYENRTFSTQSVVLMLQSSFDSSSAKFYAYNFAPKNEQANLKNLTTVKTEWKEISMPGDGVVGVIGSWLSLVSKSLAYVLLASAVLMALFTTTMVTGFIFFFKQAINSLILGSIHSLLATFLIYLGGVFSVLIAVAVPGTFIKAIEKSGQVFGSATNEVIPAGFVDITTSLITLFVAYWLSYGGRVASTGETPVRLISCFFMKMALNFEQKVSELNRKGNTNFAESFRGVGHSATNQSRDLTSKIGGRIGQDKRSATQGMRGVNKGAMSGLAKGAAVGLATGGTGAVVAGASKGLAKGASKGAMTGVKNPDGGKKGLQNALEAQGLGKGGFGEIKDAIGKGNQRKVANSAGKANAKGALNGQERREAYDQYSQARNNRMMNNVNQDAKSPNGKYGALYNTKGRLSQQSLSNADELDKIEGTDHLYDNATSEDLAGYSQNASGLASQSTYMDDEGDEMFERQRFTQAEVDSLATAKDENDFVDKLGDTTNGMGYAMDTDNARSLLSDTQFVDDSGNVDTDAVQKFQQTTDSKFKTGELSDADLKDKAKLDDAFIMGGKEKYRVANGRYENRFANDTLDNHKKAVDNESKKSSGNTGSATQYSNVSNGMTGTSDKANRANDVRRSNGTDFEKMSYKDRVESRNGRQNSIKQKTPNTNQPKANNVNRPQADTRNISEQNQARTNQRMNNERRNEQRQKQARTDQDSKRRMDEIKKRQDEARRRKQQSATKDRQASQKQQQSDAQKRQQTQRQAQQRQSQQKRSTDEIKKLQDDARQRKQQSQQRQQSNNQKRPPVNIVDNDGNERRSRD